MGDKSERLAQLTVDEIVREFREALVSLYPMLQRLDILEKIQDCKALVDRINSMRRELHGRVETIEIIGYDGRATWGVKQFALEGRKA